MCKQIELDGFTFDCSYINGVISVYAKGKELYTESIGIGRDIWVVETLWNMVSQEYMENIELSRLAKELFDER